MSGSIQPVVMPKWGLAMQEGTLNQWLVEEGAVIAPGTELCEIETSKITNVMESTVGGTLQRRVAIEGSTLPVGALIAVVTDGKADAAAIHAFIAKFEEEFAAAAREEAEAGPKNRTAEIAGTAINYLPAGEGGTPIIFIHGFGGDLNNWMFNQPELAGSRATYAVDMPGHGNSAKTVTDASLAGQTRVLVGLLDAIGIDRAHLVGHSMGGAIALNTALTHPDRVASLTLISSVGLGPEIDMGYIDGFIGAGSRREMKPHLEKLFAEPSLVTRDMVEDILKFKRLDGVTAALRATADAVFPGGRQAASLRDGLAGLKVPVQVIFGAQDKIIPPAHAQGLPANVQVHLLSNAGHMPHMEASGEVNRLIAAQAT